MVSVLFYEPKLLKSYSSNHVRVLYSSFSALLRAEIVESRVLNVLLARLCVSVLFYEPKLLKYPSVYGSRLP